MKTFRVTFTRTITVECNIVVKAKDEDKATEKAQSLADDGKLGEPDVKFRLYGGKKGPEFEIDLVEETIEVSEANEEEE